VANVCSCPGDVTLTALSARVVFLHSSFLLLPGRHERFLQREADVGLSWYLIPSLLHSLHLIELHSSLKVLKARLVTIRLFEDLVPVLLAGDFSLKPSNRPLHIFQT
jgi:hypothetical protein